jgi:CcmD family protein
MKLMLNTLVRRVLASAALLSLFASTAALAADEFVPVNEAARTRMDPNPYIIAAYGAIWVTMMAYVALVARGLGRARVELEDLKKKVDAPIDPRGR